MREDARIAALREEHAEFREIMHRHLDRGLHFLDAYTPINPHSILPGALEMWSSRGLGRSNVSEWAAQVKADVARLWPSQAGTFDGEEKVATIKTAEEMQEFLAASVRRLQGVLGLPFEEFKKERREFITGGRGGPSTRP